VGGGVRLAGDEFCRMSETTSLWMLDMVAVLVSGCCSLVSRGVMHITYCKPQEVVWWKELLACYKRDR
jgi:hypothetical protein